jgi:hypothetical protein
MKYGLGALLVIGVLLSGMTSPSANGQSNEPKKSSAGEKYKVCEILVQFKPTASTQDKSRVLKNAGASLKEEVNTPAMQSAGSPGLEVLTISYPLRIVNGQTAKDTHIDRVLTTIKSDSSVQFAELNTTYSATRNP